MAADIRALKSMAFRRFLAAFLVLGLLMFRIGNEEDVLCRDLPGYEAYRQSTRHRLIPGLW